MRLFYTQQYNPKSGNEETAGSSRSLLRRVLREHYGINEETEILRSPNGRPYINEENALFFSISHTGNLWTCAVSERLVGIDVEVKDRRIRHPERMAARFLTADEQEFIAEAPAPVQKNDSTIDPERRIFDPQLKEILPMQDAGDWDAGRRLLLLWTRKEALLKYTGDGLRRLSDAGSVLGLTAREFTPAPILRSFLCGDYLLSVCCAPEPGCIGRAPAEPVPLRESAAERNASLE